MWGLGKKHRFNDKGLSLVEIIVVSGISMVILLAFTQYQTQLAKQVKSIDQGGVYRGLVNSVSLWTAEKDTCRPVLEVSPGPPRVPRTLNLSSLYSYALTAPTTLPDTLPGGVTVPRLQLQRFFGKCPPSGCAPGVWPPIVLDFTGPPPHRFSGLWFHASEGDGFFLEPDWKQLIQPLKDAGGTGVHQINLTGSIVVRASRVPLNAAGTLQFNQSSGSPRFAGANERGVLVALQTSYNAATKVMSFNECWNQATGDKSLLELNAQKELAKDVPGLDPTKKTGGVGVLFANNPSPALAFVAIQCPNAACATSTVNTPPGMTTPPGAWARVDCTNAGATHSLNEPCTAQVPLWNFSFGDGVKTYGGKLSINGAKYKFCVGRTTGKLYLMQDGAPTAMVAYGIRYTTATTPAVTTVDGQSLILRGKDFIDPPLMVVEAAGYESDVGCSGTDASGNPLYP